MAKAHKPDVTTKAPTRQMWRRSLGVLVVLVGFCFSAIIGQLVILQIVQTDEWQKRAVAQQMSDSVISPNRGAIYDTNMNKLAESKLVWTVIMSPKNIADEDTRVLIADELSQMLEVNRDKLYQSTTKVNSEYEVVKKKIERSVVETLTVWAQENSLTNVFRIIPDYKRVYPYGSLASCVLGFIGTDNYGLYGLEAKYNDVLAGKPGRIVTAKNGWGDELPTTLKYEKTVDAQDGNSLVLTIDQTVQHYVEKYLEVAVKENALGNRGGAIVMDVNTGAIVAMATKGDFDLNNPFEVADPDQAAAIALLAQDEQSKAVQDALAKQWVNKPVSEYYEPGSVFKAFTTSMALEEGVINEKSTFQCNGYMTIGGRIMRCHIHGSHGLQTLPEAISHSCNPAFFQIGLKVGSQLYYKYFTGFGFTESTGIDMLSEAPIPSVLYHSEEELRGQVYLAASSIGQTFKVTPIQMITAMSAVANGGRLMQPYVVQQILDADGNVIKNTSPTVKRQVISEETSKRVCAMLEGVVDGGGGKNAYIAGYRLAGKTGTSVKTDQAGADDTGKDVIASFCGFAPADNPQYAVLVLLDEPHGEYRYGGTIAAPVAGKIFTDVLPYLGVEPKYTAEEVASMNRTTPNVEGKSVKEACVMIENSKLTAKVIGDGTNIVRQVPAAGKSIPKGGTVVLYTEDSGEEKMVTVPDFSRKTLSQVNSLAVNAGLNVQIAGVGIETGEAKSSEQSIAAGEKVPLGTVIKVTFIHEDQIE